MLEFVKTCQFGCYLRKLYFISMDQTFEMDTDTTSVQSITFPLATQSCTVPYYENCFYENVQKIVVCLIMISCE